MVDVEASLHYARVLQASIPTMAPVQPTPRHVFRVAPIDDDDWDQSKALHIYQQAFPGSQMEAWHRNCNSIVPLENEIHYL
jgi:hypothetical protein